MLEKYGLFFSIIHFSCLPKFTFIENAFFHTAQYSDQTWEYNPESGDEQWEESSWGHFLYLEPINIDFSSFLLDAEYKNVLMELFDAMTFGLYGIEAPWTCIPTINFLFHC